MSLDVFQQVFSLSLVSNLASGFTGTQAALQKMLQNEVNAALPNIGAGWQLAWGPVVWKNKPDEVDTGPDNAWYIVFNPSLEFEDGSVRPAYVIAIAGTPPLSEYAWFKENFAVSSVSDFNAWVGGGVENLPPVVPAKDIIAGEPYISTGTVVGVHLLLTTPAPEGAAAAGTTLLDFISNLDLSDSPVVISTGHSLGGNLSPSLALALVSAGAIPKDRVLTYPSAGASPGNSGFTDLFVETFPARKLSGARAYQGWNLNLVNTLDIVPQAWAQLKRISPEQNLANIPPIYGLPMVPLVLGATIVFTVHAYLSGVLYKPIPSQYFTGTDSFNPPTNLTEFLEILYPQHGQAYFDEVGVKFYTDVPLGDGLRRKSRDEILLNHPLLAELEWAREHPKEAQKIIDETEDTPEGQELSSKIKNGEA